MKYDFITIGGAAEDITFLANDGVLLNNKKDILRQKLLAFEYGAKIEIDGVYYNYGGGAANVAVSLSRLGFRTASIVTVGNDSRAKKLIENFKEQGVSRNLIQEDEEEETSCSFILVGPSKDRIIFFNRGAEESLKISKNEIKSLHNTKWAYLTALSGNWQESIRNIFSVKGLKVAWNPGNAQLKSGVRVIGKYLKNTEVLIINKDEAIQLIVSDSKYKKKDNKFLNSNGNLLKIVKTFGPKIVIITDGKLGARAYDGKKFYFQPIIKEKKRLDVTGVGDAFGSAFMAGLELYKGNIEKALWLGAKNSSSLVTEIGAQNGLLTREDLFVHL